MIGSNLSDGIKFFKEDLFIVKNGQTIYGKILER